MRCCRLLLVVSLCLTLTSCSPAAPSDDTSRSVPATNPEKNDPNSTRRMSLSVRRDIAKARRAFARASRKAAAARSAGVGVRSGLRRSPAGAPGIAGIAPRRGGRFVARAGSARAGSTASGGAFAGVGSISASSGRSSAGPALSLPTSSRIGGSSAFSSPRSTSAFSSSGSVSSFASVSNLDDYSYEDYSYEDYDDFKPPPPSLSFSIFDDTRAQFTRPTQSSLPKPSPCTWGVVNCCGNKDIRGSRVQCFDRHGCTGSWFEDLCIPAIKKGVFQEVFNSIQG